MAPCMLALIMFRRASRSEPLRVARSICAQPRVQAIERNAVGRRVEGGRHEGFHAVRDGVHAGGGGEQWGQAQREFGVADGGFGHRFQE
jgi:hypothetical protein